MLADALLYVAVSDSSGHLVPPGHRRGVRMWVQSVVLSYRQGAFLRAGDAEALKSLPKMP